MTKQEVFDRFRSLVVELHSIEVPIATLDEFLLTDDIQESLSSGTYLDIVYALNDIDDSLKLLSSIAGIVENKTFQ
jgi:hypothetical protein